MTPREIATPEGLRCPRCKRPTITLLGNWLSLPEVAPPDDRADVFPAVCPCVPGEVVLLEYDYVRGHQARQEGAA